MGTEEPALDAVVAADAELMALRAEEADIQIRLGAVSLEDNPESPPEASTSAANDADNDRLAAIYDRLAVRDCSSRAACASCQTGADGERYGPCDRERKIWCLR